MKLHTFLFATISAWVSLSALNASANDLTPEQLTFFETKIRPVLIRECYGCHSKKSGNARGGLTLDTKELMAIGGTTGPAIVPGDLEESWLYNAITYQDYEMPPKRKLSDNVIADFKKWIEMGAPDPRVNAITKVNSEISDEDIDLAKQSFWAYRKPVKSIPPAVDDRSWPRTAIDSFVLHKLEQADLSPADDADFAKLLRRLTFDLIGLPPTPQQIQAFGDAWRNDPDNAIAATVDELMDSEQFGERWGRHWMDVARYAESSGRGINMTYPQAWRYRDYVIDSFNEDKPFNEFVQEQLAGDLLPAKSDQQWAKQLIATTFLAIGSKNVNEDNRVQFAADLVDEQIDATTRVFLGTSVACARCHDHKFDPIPQSDYYALAGIFQSTKTFFGNPQSEFGSFSDATEKQTSSLLILPVDAPGPNAAGYTKRQLQDIQEEMESERQRMAANRRSNAGGKGQNPRTRISYMKRMAALSGILASVDANGKPKSFCMGVQDVDQPKDAKILVRGEIDQPAQVAPRAFPKVLADSQPEIGDSSSGRLELAKWIGSDRNTLTARVMVNRIWLHMIGQGIVSSTENFGATGQMPSHPELLDYLAVQFVESDWSVKSIIREIARSRVYRMSSKFNEGHHEYDPDNKLVWRANPRRLEAEAIRDAMLSVSGELDTKRPHASLIGQVGYTRIEGGRLTQSRGPGMNAGSRNSSGRALRSGQGGRTRSGMQNGPRSGLVSASTQSIPNVEHPVFTDEQVQYYEEKVKPLLTEQCINCHGSNRVRGGLQLISRRTMVIGGNSGSAIDEHQPDESLLLKMVSYADPNHQMPPSGKLSDEQIEILSTWVRMNSPWDPTEIDLPPSPSGRRFAGNRITGRSDQRSGGRSDQSPNPLDMESSKIRSVYMQMVRECEPRSLRVFDFADSSTITGQRENSSSANQSLYMMNNAFVEQQAKAFAERLGDSGKQFSEQLDEAVLLAFGRPPTAAERDSIRAFADQYSSSTGDSEKMKKTMAAICQSLFASAEFRYID